MIIFSALLPCFAQNNQYRTVIDKEVGSIFQNPNGFPGSVYGFFDGSAQSLDPAALRGIFTHLDKFDPDEDTYARGFPYAALRAYEAEQVKEGKAPIFVTATYAGKSRPVVFSWSLGTLVNGKPTASPDLWQYAVNTQDPRFIHFYINHYIQPMIATYQVWPNVGPDLWFHADQCAFFYTLFGVLDDNNNFIPGVTWDQPFPQNQAEYETAIETLFSQVKTLAPNINIITNLGSQFNPSHFPQLFANVGGAIQEDLHSWRPNPDSATRAALYTNFFQYLPWMASQGRVGLTRALIPTSDPEGLFNSFVVYSLVKGENFFFAPGDYNGYNLDPSTWASWRAQLGNPTTPMQVSNAYPGGVGSRLFHREFEGGIIYLNWTGSTQTIQLEPNFNNYYDPNGNHITSHRIQIPDATGTYVTWNPTALPAPRISPRYSGTAIGPIPVTIESDTPNATLRYTLNGDYPNASSPVYTGAVEISSSTIVRARAFVANAGSYESTAQYTVSSAPLTVQLQLQSDSGLAGSYYPVLSLSAIPTASVSVTYSVQNGTPAKGVYTFPAGMTYGILPLTTSSSGTMTVTLTSAVGTTLGRNHTLQYAVTQ